MSDNENKPVIDADEMSEDEEDPIDDEQLDEYRELVEQLGTFPDKVKINSLSMVAEDHADSRHNAGAIYQVIRQPLVSKSVPGDRKLPLVYVIDSILKNVKGKFIPVIENDAKNWLPVVHQKLSEDKRTKLKKVWNLWKDAGVFSEDSWKEMGSCFAGSSAEDSSDGAAGTSKLEKAGILGKDAGLLLMPKLRDAMQTILDDLQSDVQDELEKVSLERLASIDTDLLIKIKRTAEDSLRNGGTGNGSQKSTPQNETDTLSFLVETRTPETIVRSKAWAKLNLDHLKETHDMIAALQHLVIDVSRSEARYTQREAIEMTGALAAAGATASILTNALEKINDEEKKSKSSAASGISGGGAMAGAAGATALGFTKVNKKLFTNEGIKKKNEAVIGILYEVGLPFVSSADGRRFGTQLELSNHLDALFKKGQLEKTMARTEERGWYISDSVWSGGSKADEEGNSAEETPEADGPTTAEEEADPSTFTMPADESRDRCVICGINFKMFFDNDDGIYKYSNCREIEVLNDEAAAKESEEMLVHLTCWRALGSPPVLNSDQALQEAIHS